MNYLKIVNYNEKRRTDVNYFAITSIWRFLKIQ